MLFRSQNIPGDLIEAAEIDGATSWQVLKNVTLPMVMPSITVCTFLLQLAQDFGLSYEDWKPPGKAKKPKPRQKSPEEQFQEAKNRCFRILADYLHPVSYTHLGFQAMLADIEAGKVGTVIVKDMSRLGRTGNQ